MEKSRYLHAARRWQLRWRGQRYHPCGRRDRKSTRLNSSHSQISYAVFCLKKKINATHSDDPLPHLRYLPHHTHLPEVAITGPQQSVLCTVTRHVISRSTSYELGNCIVPKE